LSAYALWWPGDAFSSSNSVKALVASALANIRAARQGAV
jgi:hypothetical protein